MNFKWNRNTEQPIGTFFISILLPQCKFSHSNFTIFIRARNYVNRKDNYLYQNNSRILGWLMKNLCMRQKDICRQNEFLNWSFRHYQILITTLLLSTLFVESTVSKLGDELWHSHVWFIHIKWIISEFKCFHAETSKMIIGIKYNWLEQFLWTFYCIILMR